jgi:hypothetical protein
LILEINSKNCLKLIKTRLETIRKKRNAVQKFLKKDLVDLLRNSLEYNAYGRVIFNFLVNFDSFLINFLCIICFLFFTFVFGLDCSVRNNSFSPMICYLKLDSSFKDSYVLHWYFIYAHIIWLCVIWWTVCIWKQAEGFLVEQNMSACYELIAKFAGCISSHVRELSKQEYDFLHNICLCNYVYIP